MPLGEVRLGKMSDNKFDVIVVGAGPAGIAAALTLAKAGTDVIVIERGIAPGSKNMMGGVLYSKMLNDLVPKFWEEAPIERHIAEEHFWFTSKGSAFKVAYRGERFTKEPYNAFSVLRAKFDPWFAKKAEEAGAMIIPETTVTDVIRKGKQIVGISTDRAEGDLYADVVIAADGAVSMVSKKAGLQEDKPFPPEHLVVGCKEVIALPKGVIEERFHLTEKSGVSIDIFGDVLQGMAGFGFLYTNLDTISIGHGILLSELMETKIKPYDVLDSIKQHPCIAPLIRDGEVKEYAAKMIPEGGYYAMPRLYGPGILVAGDAAMMTNAAHGEGSNLAMEAGKLAGEAALHALKAKDFSAKRLSLYENLLKKSFVMPDLRKSRNVARFLAKEGDIMATYPDIINALAERFITVDGNTKKEHQKRMMLDVLRRRSVFRLIGDGWKMFRAFA